MKPIGDVLVTGKLKNHSASDLKLPFGNELDSVGGWFAKRRNTAVGLEIYILPVWKVIGILIESHTNYLLCAKFYKKASAYQHRRAGFNG